METSKWPLLVSSSGRPTGPGHGGDGRHQSRLHRATIALFLAMLALAIGLGCSESDSSEEARRAAVVSALDTLAADLLEDRPADAVAYMERLQTYLEAHPSFFGSAAALLDRSGRVISSPYVYRTADGYASTGSIPAWAGEPESCSRLTSRWTVYPRVGGGTQISVRKSSACTGLSPRGRGNLNLDRRGRQRVRSIPAWAGEPFFIHPNRACHRVYPRVGGGTLLTALLNGFGQGLSPRGRGNPDFPAPWPCSLRSIPAWAGEPPMTPPSAPAVRVYPRVGGEPPMTPPSAPAVRVYPRVGGGTESSISKPAIAKGLSPRGRGNRQRHDEQKARQGSIPAWAGEP